MEIDVQREGALQLITLNQLIMRNEEERTKRRLFFESRK